MAEFQEDEAIEYVTYLSKMRGLSIKTIKDYLNYFKRLDTSNISQESVDSFLKRCKNNNVVRGMLRNYIEMRGLEREIILPRPSKRKSIRLIRPITNNEIQKLREYLYNNSFKKGIIFDLMYEGALRRVEVPTIKINSFAWANWIEEGMINPLPLIVLGKNDKEREVRVNEELGKAILSQIVERYHVLDYEQLMVTLRSDNPLFQYLTEKIVYDIISNGSKKILGRDIRCHEIRHHRSSELESMGVQLKDIKNYLGHEHLNTTEIYLHSTAKDSLKNIDKILIEHKKNKEVVP